ncbi:MAG: uroporphyrinogen-III C-methyltransferase [Rhodoplanes sp.]|uniref:NAD(P)-dependent oxidoreductase n=1 Tax=Rhodoplanes sp. TaxID=1968906 RepID=UPI0017F52111|nr:NAD(P)-dependent oxidoreductase [Rhodoplanes sp.]NVO12443.1 uroporphyrinogen-III C-methyltransferase [Rhodoplanes sp.]
MSRPEHRSIDTRAAGLAPLAVLPVFVRLRGERAVVLGGSAGAAWKARLLASAGARVDVIATEFCDEMRAAPGAVPDGRVALHARAWSEDDVHDARIVIVALDDAADARRAVGVARKCGAMVNAVDRSELCDVQFGAIVNRSPLVIGISTDGAAPVLAQTLRSRIEALIPTGLARWLAAAKSWRAEVAERLPAMPARRAFWLRLADRAFAAHAGEPSRRDLDDLLAGGAGPGGITVVDAGPGDPELLTLAAVRALRSADVVLHDAGVSSEVLAFARREARMLPIGAADRRVAPRLDAVGDLMIRFARESKRVVRLTCGPSGVPGWTTEGIAAARTAGVVITIVPGVAAVSPARSDCREKFVFSSVSTRMADMRAEAARVS